MSEQTPQEPRDFDQLENDTAKWQEEEYMKSLMGRGLNENDASSEKRREEAKAYDAHLRGLKDRDNDPTFKTDLKDEDVFKDTVTEINPIQKKIDLLSQQIMEIEASYKEKGSTDADRLSTVVEKDLESKKALRNKLLAELRQENDGLLEKSPASDPVIDQENVNQLIDELNEYDENKNGDSDDHENDSDDTITPLVPVDPIPPTDPGEVIGDGETPGPDIVLREPMPQDPAERQSWFQRNRQRIMGGAALLALAGALAWASLTEGDKKDNKRTGSDEKTEQTQKQNAQSSAEHDKFMSQFKVNKSDDHDKNKTVSSGFEQGDSAKEASEQLKKNLGHHPVLLAEVVYAYQNGIGVDEARQHVDEINKMAKSFVNGDYLNADGRKWAEKLGSSIDKGSARWVTEEEMNHATWYNSGIEEKGNFDKFFINDNAGFSSEKILRVRLANGKIVYFKEDCVNMLLKDKIETESTNTFDGGSTFTDTDRTNSEIEDDPKDPDTEKKKKGKAHVDDHGTADTGGVRSEGPGNPEEKTTGGQTDAQSEQQAGAGTGTADGATEAERPAGSSNGASGQTSNGTVGE